MAKIGNITLTVNVTNVKRFIEELRGLQTYKMFKDDSELYLSRDDVYALLLKYLNIETECGRCPYYDAEEDVCEAFVCDGIDCPELPCEKGKV